MIPSSLYLYFLSKKKVCDMPVASDVNSLVNPEHLAPGVRLLIMVNKDRGESVYAYFKHPHDRSQNMGSVQQLFDDSFEKLKYCARGPLAFEDIPIIDSIGPRSITVICKHGQTVSVQDGESGGSDNHLGIGG
jgi:hypothetical protein